MDYIQTLMPAQTDYLVPNEVIAHSEATTAYRTWYVFDTDTATRWAAEPDSRPNWIGINYTDKILVTKYEITCSLSTGEAITQWEFQGSDDGITWEVLDSRIGITDWTNGYNVYEFINTVEYSQYRVYVIDGAHVNFTSITDIRIYSAALPTHENIDTSTGEIVAIGYDGYVESNAIVQDGTDGDFTVVKNIQSKEEYANISEATVADTLVTSSPIADGDNLVIVKDDDSIHEVVASNVIPLMGPGEWDEIGSQMELLSPTHVNKTANSTWTNGNAFFSIPLVGNVYFEYIIGASANSVMIGICSDRAFQTNHIGNTINGHAIYNTGNYYTNNTNVAYASSWVQGQIIGVRYNSTLLELEFYIDGVAQGIISVPDEEYYPAVSFYYAGDNAQIFTDVVTYQPAGTELLLKVSGYGMDTSIVTQSEIPTRVFTVDSKLSFNAIEANEASNNYALYIPTVDPLIMSASANITIDQPNLSTVRNNTSWDEGAVYLHTPIVGNMYWEFTFTGSYPRLGICPTIGNNYYDEHYKQPDGYGYIEDGGLFIAGSVIPGLGNSYTNANRLGVRYNSGNGELEYYIDGVSQFVRVVDNPALVYYPAYWHYNNNNPAYFHNTNLLYQPAGTIAYGAVVPISNILENTRAYTDADIAGREIVTRVDLKSISDKTTEVSGDIYRDPVDLL